MTTFFAKQKKPNPNNNYFKQYASHLAFIELDTIEFENRFWSLESQCARFTYLAKGIASRISLLDRLRDGHDYIDEVMGATLVPIFSAANVLLLTLTAIWHGVNFLAIKTALAKDDYEKHGSTAVSYLMGAGMSLVFAVVSLIKSAVSLLTRPIVTAIHGFAEQDTERFYDESFDSPSAMLI